MLLYNFNVFINLIIFNMLLKGYVMTSATNSNKNHADVLVIGGGLVGSAVVFGIAETGARVIMLDEGDRAFRAARGNAGLV